MHRYTAPLTGNLGTDGLPILSDGYHLIAFAEKYHKAFDLDLWQKTLLIRILERCPEGHPRAGQLRYRQCVVSIPRQNGKSVLASLLALYGLLQHSTTPRVLGLARGREQAEIVYGYTKDVVTASQALRSLLRETSTRGITHRTNGGTYKVLPAKPEAVQGYLSTLAICDELHVMKPEIWNAVVQSQRAQIDPLLIGITTAGDISSILLKRLYEQGDKAIAGAQESFGFFVWEATSDELTLESITEANPAVACGRISAQSIYDDDFASPPSNWKRFTLNRFVDGLAEPWVPVEAWAKCAGTGLEDFYDCIYAFDVTSTWSHATITASKMIDGVVHQSLVARIVKPTPEQLQKWADRLRKAGKCSFVMDPNRLRSLTEYLDNKGREPMRIYGGRKSEAAGITYAAIMRGEVNHDNQPFVNTQHATAKTKSTGDQFVIVPNAADADACYASVYGIYAAITIRKRGIGIA